MLRDAKVEYLAWARDAQRAPRRVSLLLSGCDTPLDRIPFRTEDLRSAVPPAYEDSRLLEGLAARYGVSADEVFPCLGTSQALFLALAGLLSPGDGVLIEHPGYESLRRVSEALGAQVRTFTRRHESDFAIQPDRVLEAWQPDVRVVALTDLHNPTGCMAGDQGLARLAEALRERGTMLLVDEVYRDFRPGALGTARTLGENVVILSSFTKVYGLGNLRAGWILGPRELVQ
ncbi:MAG TPA: pyridoxal phosphate-dependent aminotransferase, partial [Candidatus Eisenbacteria bacterium]|nr:pyridoxal phosphate-dependent aminotransferase [Candidatus Eisenbacteria bacterium]